MLSAIADFYFEKLLFWRKQENDFHHTRGHNLIAIQLSFCYCDRFPKVRKLMADKFYLLLLSSGEQYFGEEVNDACIEYLLSVDWLEMVSFLSSFTPRFLCIGSAIYQLSAAHDSAYPFANLKPLFAFSPRAVYCV